MNKLNVLKVNNKENMMASLKTLPHIDEEDFWGKKLTSKSR